MYRTLNIAYWMKKANDAVERESTAGLETSSTDFTDISIILNAVSMEEFKLLPRNFFGA